MTERSPHWQLLPWAVIAIALSLMATLLVTRFVDLRKQSEHRVTSQLGADIAGLALSWEERIEDSLDKWVDESTHSSNTPWVTEERLRNHEAWADSLYLWSGSPTDDVAEFVYPTQPYTKPTVDLNTLPCFLDAKLLRLNKDFSPEEVAQAYLSGCADQALEERLFATMKAVRTLQDAGLFTEALNTIQGESLELQSPLIEVIKAGLNPSEAVTRRLKEAELLILTGEAAKGLNSIYDTGLSLSQLPAPTLEKYKLFQFIDWPILTTLESHQRADDVAVLRAEQEKAEQRVLAYHEIDSRVIKGYSHSENASSRFIIDQFNDNPFLLFFHPSTKNEVGVAIQMDQKELVRDFLTSVRRHRRNIVITDAAGIPVDGLQRREKIAVSVPFARVLPHLRVGLRASAVDRQMEQIDDQIRILFVLGFSCLILGYLGLSAQYRANGRLKSLITRQTEFTRRVTHELKTPLAGIRIIAENLESGIYSEGREIEMAGRIIAEADRLSTRVNDILVVGRQTSIPNPAPFFPEEAIYEAIDLWGPRLGDAGIALKADLQDTDEALGDATGIRDVIGCLLDNSLKYRKASETDSKVWIRLFQQRKSIFIEVIDNGMGIPNDKRTEIFDRFVRIEGPNRGMAGGYGLGLAQVRSVMSSHDGKVWREDGVDGGVKFILKIRAHSPKS